jgi:hypothetical protein
MGLITENNAHYYSGQQTYVYPATGGSNTIAWIGDVVLVKTEAGKQNSNYEVFKNNVLLTETTNYTLSNGVVNIIGSLSTNDVIVIQLKQRAREKNYGGYAYISLDEVINNFIVAYVGEDKLIPRVKRTDVIFHAKRGLQEFSYDTINSIKSQELTVPLNLSIPIPQDYVNYVSMSCVDEHGLVRPIFPNSVSKAPTDLPLQDNEGIPMQDSFGNNSQATNSLTETRFGELSMDKVNGPNTVAGGRYGLNPSISNTNGMFIINKREGKFSFSSDLADKIIILEYLSDGLAYDVDTKLPKMAEEAMYAHIVHAIVSGRSNQPEYVVNRLKRERSAKLRNAKIRLSNIKLSEIINIMRNQSKLIKH